MVRQRRFGPPQVLAAVLVLAGAVALGFVLGMARPRRQLTFGGGFERPTGPVESDAGDR